jgi:hypothetical protein
MRTTKKLLAALKAGEKLSDGEILALHGAGLARVVVVDRSPNGRLLDRSKWTLRAVLKPPSRTSVGGGGAAARRAKPPALVFGQFGPVDYEGGRMARVTLNGVEVGRVLRVADEVHRPGCTYARMFVVTGYKAEVDTRGLRALGVDEVSANRAWDACDFDVDHKTLGEAKDALRKGIAAAFQGARGT